MRIYDLIAKKRDGGTHSREELELSLIHISALHSAPMPRMSTSPIGYTFFLSDST